jgi:hypothetical protein
MLWRATRCHELIVVDDPKQIVHKRGMRTFRIIEKLGGIDQVFVLLTKRGLRITTPDAIRMWRSPSRGMIPGAAMVLLMEACEAQQIKYCADDFRLVERDPALAAERSAA